MIDPTVLAGVAAAQAAHLPDTATVSRPGRVKNPDGFGHIEGPASVVYQGPTRLVASASVVDTSGRTVKPRGDFTLTFPAGTVPFRMGDLVEVQSASGVVKCRVATTPVSTLGTVVRVYCETVGVA